ncbi:hypothetical protein [Arhodomonas sp. AD133]|uniref:hypothetical protein n=1 Tax=Arhodomonas sp. AD133 TaxID=3415009 RepID=UPI003EBBF945
MNLRGYTAEHSDQIPRSPGIYAFYVLPLTLGSLGLYRDVRATDEELEVARNILRKRIDALRVILQPPELDGTLSDKPKRGPLRTRYSISCNPIDLGAWVDAVDQVPTRELKAVAQVIAFSSLFLTPVYVGVAARQTLFDRYVQHKRDYYADGSQQASFGQRLRETGLDWSEIIFSCSNVDIYGGMSEHALMFVEDYFHAMAKPKFSMS